MNRFAWWIAVGLVVFLQAPNRAFADDSPNDEALTEGRRLRRTGHYAEAAAIFERLRKAAPVEASLELAELHRETGKREQAIALLESAAEAAPNEARIPARLARLHFESGDYEACRKQLDRALQLDENELLARWLTAELHRVHGRMPQADDGYLHLVRYYNRHQRDVTRPEQLHLVGLAAGEYARWHRNSRQFSFLVNTLYPDALKLDADYWPARLEAALLFLEKYNQSDALKEITAGLAINANAAELHAAKARLALQNYNLDEARKSLDRALEINPRLVVAHQLQADMLLANFQPHEALTVLEAARKLNPRDEETLGRLAASYGAVDGLREDTAGTRMGEVIDEVVARNEHCGVFFAALGATLDRLRKFPFAAKYYRQAYDRMPQLVAVRGQLGMMYMRLGEEAEAAKLLNESFEVDPFNVRVKNTLAVLDVLSKYAVLETEHFVIRFDRGSDEILAQYAARYLEDEVYPEMVARLGYEPRGKSLFEIFAKTRTTSAHSWFSARMVGLPYVGTVGACAGKMVAIASPNDMPSKFNWARVLRHEFVHVVNLQQTDFNIPHWFTEALAVWHEDMPRPPSWLRVLARRAREDSLFTLDNINLGFIRPSSSDDWTLAYCQSELYAEYALHAHGDDALTRLLAAYADNLTTEQAIRRALGVDVEQFEAGYRKYVDKLLADEGVIVAEAPQPVRSLAELEQAIAEKPDDADLAAQLAYAYLQRDDKPTARKWAEKAIEVEPRQQLAAYVMARLLLSIGDAKGALARLEGALDNDQPQSNLLSLLAGLKLRSRDYAAAERLYELGAKKFPEDPQWNKLLAAVYLQSNQQEKLAGALAKLAEVDYDNAILCKKLAQLAAERNDRAATIRWANQTLHIDVMDAEVHALLAKALEAEQQYDRAALEYETATRLDGDQLDWRFAQAQAAHKAGHKDRAIAALKALIAIDPDYAGAQALLENLSP
ncbi:MAG: tetratricopeptide repeat protein [Pirellulaceae bacterium]